MTRKMRISRSQPYAIAISDFLESQRTKKITERLNKVHSGERSGVDAALQSAQLQSLRREGC
jgi:hypothetical protein